MTETIYPYHSHNFEILDLMQKAIWLTQEPNKPKQFKYQFWQSELQLSSEYRTQIFGYVNRLCNRHHHNNVY